MTTQPLAIERERLYTAEEALSIRGTSGRWELIEGRIVEMGEEWTGGEHGVYESNFSRILGNYAYEKQTGKVLVGQVGIYISRNPDTVRAADVLYISNERYAQMKSSSALDVAPEMVVEVMSPNDTWDDVIEKLRDYFLIGVRVVWVVSPKSHSVFAYRSLTDVREFGKDDELTADDVLPLLPPVLPSTN